MTNYIFIARRQVKGRDSRCIPAPFFISYAAASRAPVVPATLSFIQETVVELACLDLEGVLIPEIWIAFAEKTGIEELKATTRDIPDYDVLMKQRLRILDQHGYGLPEIQEVIGTLDPLPGAREFLDWLRER